MNNIQNTFLTKSESSNNSIVKNYELSFEFDFAMCHGCCSCCR